MNYTTTRVTLEGIVRWLESIDEEQWENQIHLTTEARYELQRMSDGSVRMDKTGGRSAQMPTFSPESRKAAAAIPAVEEMIQDMMERNRPSAIEHGRAALTRLA